MRKSSTARWFVFAGTLAVTASAWGQLSEEAMRSLEQMLPPPASQPVDFETDIRPILEASCLRCHGPERPRGKFRLTSRANALEGGSQGVAIVPGQSASSPLIYYVARLVEEMEMPPSGRDEPLTPGQVSLLRGWIDQGASWGEAPSTRARTTLFSITPSLRWFSVEGDERRFREHTGMKEGWGGGFQRIYLQEQLEEGRRLTFEGQIYFNPETYKLALALEQRDFGFLRMGAEQYREYYDDSGGYFPGFSPPAFDLGRDLHLDVGRVWTELGLMIPDRPRFVLGYEYRYRDGTKSTLHWGDAGFLSPETDLAESEAKKIFPGAETIDEQVHILKLDATHEVRGVRVENLFRAEFYEREAARRDVIFHNLAIDATEKYMNIREGHDHWQLSDSFRLEKQVVDWLFLSGGYNYSRLNGNYSLSTEPVYPIGLVNAPAEYWFTDSIVLEQNTHVVNGNAQLGPWGGLILYGGAQSEWLRQRGMGSASLDFGDPVDGVTAFPAMMDSNLDRAAVEERLGARYTAIPFTVLFAEGRLAQESIGQWEELTGGFYPFLRDTDASSELGEARFGFTLSPWSRLSLNSHYRYREKDSRYSHLLDETFGFPNPGYPAFITGREIRAHEIRGKLSIRASSWLRGTLGYQQVMTDYTTETEEDRFASPGGSILAGNYDAQVYSAALQATPWHRLRMAGSFTWTRSRMVTGAELQPLLRPYEGDLWSAAINGTYLLNEKTELTAGYNYSWADYGQEDVTGLPVGLVFDWHIVNAGISRTFRKNFTGNLQYRFFHYDEQNTGGLNNYIAHGVLASLAMTFE